MACFGIILLALVAVSHCSPHYELDPESIATYWKDYKSEFGLFFGETEEVSKVEAFVENLKFINEHNSNYDQGKSSFFCGWTPFTHMTNAEYSSTMLMNVTLEGKTDENAEEFTFDEGNNADSLDWRSKGAVTPVKIQGQCQSCWTFSATGAIEGIHQIKTGKLVSLSEQQILDCNHNGQGCRGGHPDKAMDYVVQAGGIESEQSYPYKAQQGQCRFNRQNVVAKISGHKTIARSEQAMMSAIQKQPLSICLASSSKAFQNYKGGVFDSKECGNKADHAVLAVGYGSDKGKPYWIVKNSWGVGWGDNGYIYIVRNKNMCDISSNTNVPTA